ncbi:MAG: CRISPR-associated protein Cas5 [Elusimicrobiota bacterium]|jgi:CRISPR-associated protein Cas5h|nr:CRISPR-associated protein Cas5 [Elusimicrobiota bacterium]
MIEKVIKFKLFGKFAHFRKFYTNASSLSYLLPPRTVILGLIASILEYKRDSYYEILNNDFCKISVNINQNCLINRSMQTLNYIASDYYSVLGNGGNKAKSMHTQCQLELLIGNSRIEYIVYIGFRENNEIVSEFESRLKNKNFGFGIYLGQKQFRGFLEDIEFIEDVKFLEKTNFLDTIIDEGNVENLNFDENSDILSEQMPVEMAKEFEIKKTKKEEIKIENGRRTIEIKKYIFEKNGNRINGKFKNCYEVKDKIISFY